VGAGGVSPSKRPKPMSSSGCSSSSSITSERFATIRDCLGSIGDGGGVGGLMIGLSGVVSLR